MAELYAGLIIAWESQAEHEAEFADAWHVENQRFQHAWIPLANDPTTRGSTVTKDLAERWDTHRLLLPDYASREHVGWFNSKGISSFYGIQLEPSFESCLAAKPASNSG